LYIFHFCIKKLQAKLAISLGFVIHELLFVIEVGVEVFDELVLSFTTFHSFLDLSMGVSMISVISISIGSLLFFGLYPKMLLKYLNLLF